MGKKDANKVLGTFRKNYEDRVKQFRGGGIFKKKTAQEIEDKATYLEAQGGKRKYNRAQKLYAKSDALKGQD